MIGGKGFQSSGKVKLQFVSDRQKAGDCMKMPKDLSLAQEERHLCGEEWIFQQDNVVIHNASITKKYLPEQKINLLDHPAGSPDLDLICLYWLFRKFMKEVDSTQQFLNSKTQS